MYGTTRCPYCASRAKITEAQLEAYSGMVRCGHCRKTFDARADFVLDLPSPQLELPMLDMPPLPQALPILQPMTLAEQVDIVDDVEESEGQSQKRTWPWTVGVLASLLILLAQAAYFFRVDIAARLPVTKPALMYYCGLLKCDVPLPQHVDLVGIESSELEAVPNHPGFITLNALLRNRASYPQAFPNLQLTLTDSQDNPLARRTFVPEDYLPLSESRAIGLRPNRELSIKLPLDTADLQPMGYRLAVFYPER